MGDAVLAPAKVNLTLHVTGQREDGYHLLDSLVVFADLGDRLWFAAADSLSLAVSGPFAAGVPADAGNLIWQAAELAGVTAAITVEKNLPHGGGIGGGSSDAAALLRHYGASVDASRLGADVPVCLMPHAQRMRGTGELLETLDDLPALNAVLVNPMVHVPTPSVFKRLEEKRNAPMPEAMPPFADAAELIDWLATQRNDLQTPAISLAPQIGAALAALQAQPETRLARMSGSGSTCFGLFETMQSAEDAAARIARSHPDWWVRATTLS